MSKTRQVEWIAEQVCGECGEGVFANVAGDALCVECGHMHAMDTTNLDECERFEWLFSTQETAHRHGHTLHVVSYL